MSELFLNVVNMSLSASIVTLAVLALRFLLKGAPKKWSYLLWSVVGFRLCCPVSVRAVFSLFRALPARPTAAEVAAPASVPASAMEYVPRNIAYMSRPQVNVGVPAINQVVSDSLPAATPLNSMNPMQFWIFLAALIWVAGMAVLLGVSLWRYVQMKRLVLDAVRMERGVYETDAISSPFILGFFRPVIYLPLGLNGERRRYVLEHERYHLKRKDHLTRLFAFLLLAIHWFNPLVWLGYYLMGKDMEMSCDEAVLGMEEGREKEYSATLLSFAVAGRFPGLLAFGEASVKSRIRNALSWKRPRTWVSLLAGLLCVALVVSCAVNPTTETPKESPAESPTNQLWEGLPEDSAASPWGVTLVASDVTPRGLTLTISQAGGDATGRLRTGSFYVVERWTGSAWEALDPLPMPSGVTRAWTTEGWLIEKNTSQTGKVNWMDLYGEIPGGTYRIGKRIMDFRKPGDFDEKMAYALFRIEEGAYIPAMMQIPIPEEYAELVEVESTVDRVSLYERRSREDFRADFEKDPWPDYDHPDQVGMGWLCTLKRVSEAEMLEDGVGDMSGVTFFGRDDTGYYVRLQPTDVRFYREGGVLDDPEGWRNWEELQEWAATVPKTYLSLHPEVEPYAKTNTQADIFLSRAACWDLELILTDSATGQSCSAGNVPHARNYSARLAEDYTFEWVSVDTLGQILTAPTLSLSSATQGEDYWTVEFWPGENFVRVAEGDMLVLFRAIPRAGITEPIGDVARAWFDEAQGKGAELSVGASRLLNAALAELADENGAKDFRGNIARGVVSGSDLHYTGYDPMTAWNGRGYAYGIVNNFSYTEAPGTAYPGGNHVRLTFSDGKTMDFFADAPDLIQYGKTLYRAEGGGEDIFTQTPYALARSWFDECEYGALLDDYDSRHLTYPGPDEDYLMVAHIYATGYERLHAQVADGSKHKYSFVTTRVKDAPEATEAHRKYDGTGDKTWAFTTTTVFVPENQRAERECWAGNTMDYAEYLAEGGEPVDGQPPEGALVYFRCGYVTRQEDGTWKGSIVGTGW